jgi:hypothetical protein
MQINNFFRKQKSQILLFGFGDLQNLQIQKNNKETCCDKMKY